MAYTNNEVVSRFERGLPGKSLHMTSTGDKLYSYYTVVAQRIQGRVVKNATKYSRTTSKQTGQLSYDVLTTQHVPIGTQDLSRYL